MFFKYVFSETICDSTETEPYCPSYEILAENQLTHLIPNNLDVRRVIPPQFSGTYGMDYIKYTVPSVEVEAEIQKWQREPDKFGASTSSYPTYSIPKWWPPRNEVVDVGYIYKNHRNTTMNIWVNRRLGNFYIYAEWGH